MTTPTLVLLVRHGETEYHHGNRYCGRTDLPLTDTGRSQAARLADWAAGAGLAAVYSSTMRRAVDTAVPAARAAGVAHIRDPRLVELDFGDAEGLTPSEMEQRWPVERAAFLADPVASPLPGGESPRAAIARARAAVEELAAAHDGGTVLVVCHSTLLRLLTCDLIGDDPSRYRDRFPKVGNTSGAVLRSTDGDWELLAFNPRLAADESGY